MLLKRYEQDSSYKMKPKYMSDEALSEMYSARPVTSSDVIFYQKAPRKVFLTTRILKPGEGLWVVGGARKAGETAAQTIVRRVQDETSLEVDESRFKLLGIIEYIWPYREQKPSDEGRHDINYVFSLEVTDEELTKAAVNLDPTEYNAEAGLRPFGSIDELKAAGAKQNIIDYYLELFGE